MVFLHIYCPSFMHDSFQSSNTKSSGTERGPFIIPLISQYCLFANDSNKFSFVILRTLHPHLVQRALMESQGQWAYLLFMKIFMGPFADHLGRYFLSSHGLSGTFPAEAPFS